jgi:DUF971 family protein
MELIMVPIQIKQDSPTSIFIKWDDGHASNISLKRLRDACPCASCQGETILLKTYKPAPKLAQVGVYTLSGIEQVGHYAIQISWADGHSTGIYPWVHLKNLCECDECNKEKE